MGYLTVAEQMADLVACVYDRCAILEMEPNTAQFQTVLDKEKACHGRSLDTMEKGGICGFTYLAHMLKLTAFETHCFRMALAVELDSNLEGIYAKAQDGICRLPTLTLCLDTFTPDQFQRSKALTNWRLDRERLKLLFDQGLMVDTQQSDLTVGLKVSPRIVDFCLEPTAPNNGLEGTVILNLQPVTMVVHQDLEQRLTEQMTKREPTLYHIVGQQGAGKRTLVRRVLTAQKGAPLMVDVPVLLGKRQWQSVVTQICREVVLTNGVPVLVGCDSLIAPPENRGEGGTVDAMELREPLALLLQRLSKVTTTVFVLSETKWHPALYSDPFQKVELAVPDSTTEERMALFAHYFGGLSLERDVVFGDLAVKFTMTPAQIAQAAQEATAQQAVTNEAIHRICRNQLAHGLGKMATLIPAVYGWNDLILPPKQKEKLQNACAQVEHRHRVYHSWGFGAKRVYGRGLSVLFSGPPGTGKTMAAQVIANRLHLDLYKVDVASVMSKYIGETEKQLGAVFDEVKKSQSILFFDEADAIFGKRSETKDSHDRYANVQTAYLLQKMEEYDGIVLLASNYLENFDEAFKRRITYIIDFALPDETHRGQIWRSVLPPDAPLAEDVDVDFLARSFPLSGSSIKNIALSAAFLAVQADSQMTMTHLLLATKDEQEKGGKLLRREDFGEYYLQIAPYL